MKMGSRPGYMIYSGYGGKVHSFDKLPELLQYQLNNNVPLYKEAPKGVLDVENMTSWLAFKLHFEDYLTGKTFPLPAKSEDEESTPTQDKHPTQDAEKFTIGIAP